MSPRVWELRCLPSPLSHQLKPRGPAQVLTCCHKPLRSHLHLRFHMPSSSYVLHSLSASLPLDSKLHQDGEVCLSPQGLVLVSKSQRQASCMTDASLSRGHWLFCPSLRLTVWKEMRLALWSPLCVCVCVCVSVSALPSWSQDSGKGLNKPPAPQPWDTSLL